MLCQQCNKNTATVHLTKFINDEKTELHLCQECARQNSEINDFNVFAPFTINDLLAGFMDMSSSAASINRGEVPKCESCGTTYTQFRKFGLFGCKDCYKYFNKELAPILKKVQGGMQHTGKVPNRIGKDYRIKRKIQELKVELQKAVEIEAFEEAARLRDEIRQLEKGINTGQGGGK